MGDSIGVGVGVVVGVGVGFVVGVGVGVAVGVGEGVVVGVGDGVGEGVSDPTFIRKTSASPEPKDLVYPVIAYPPSLVCVIKAP